MAVMPPARSARVVALGLAVCLSPFLVDGIPGFREALPGYRFEFPRDHFNHPDFQTEWWYYTGNLHAGRRRYGFELVFFRQGQRRGQEERRSPFSKASAWRADDLYLAHLAITDIDAARFRYFERLNRAGPGVAGVSFDDGRIWNGNWEVRWDKASGTQTLRTLAGGLRLTLRLTPRTPPVINGENGVSQKAEGAGKASYYVSLPLLSADGALNGTAVAGTAWMDHEWFTHPLEENQQGWDWFSIQLDSAPGGAGPRELMLSQIRRTDGTLDPHSSGTYIAPDGRATHLKHEDFHLDPMEFWISPRTHARYPIAWRITVPALGLSLEARAALAGQELVPENGAGPAYWEGAVTYSGSASGVGYLEMTGYRQPMRL